MKRTLVVSGAAALAATALAAVMLRGSGPEPAPVEVAAKSAMPTLYCEFYNFVGRAPKVGFTFAVARTGDAPTFTQVNQIEADGTRIAFGGDGAAPPRWTFEAETPPNLVSPDDAIRIVLYGYEGTKSAGTWFEAGLRSIQYLNLDGKCRRYGT
ncbi:hypothetical protein [Methylobacterium sp. J-090]|uniref:hypothetical protein n=1 Tax=Methylobacterium sp. J-090 TaxID=2836666 RepID=UPI001FBBFDD5|nr:hypothetical protein [Methylobacterium sp. J-090]MCJ2081275.1 hypothetical protein [Methylobacterium sp. J-090]